MTSKIQLGEISSRDLNAIAEMLKMIADVTRLKILRVLHEGPKAVGEIVEMLGTTQGNISKHLGLMSQAGLVRGEKKSRSVIYSISSPEVDRLCEAICRSYSRLRATPTGQ